MTLGLERYKKLMNVKELLFLNKKEEAFEELSKLLKEVPPEEDLNWFGCNAIDACNCETLVEFYMRFGSRFDFKNCSNLSKLAICLSESVSLKELIPVVRAVVAQGRAGRLTGVVRTKSYKAIRNMADALEAVGELALARSILVSACREGMNEACEEAVQVSYT
ncbi:MAG: DUF1955 domain-containing protein [Thermoprotei archaeon]